MPGIEETMGGNSQSYTSKEVDLEDVEELQLEPEPLSPSSDSCSQDVEKDEHMCKNPKRKRNTKKLYLVKRSCPARFAKETPFKKFKEAPMFEYPKTVPNRVKLPKTQTSVLQEPSHEPEQMDFGEFDQDVRMPLPRRYLYKSRCKSISKYWQSVERYCRAITKSDIKYLHQLIAKQEHKEAMHYSIPPLGEHYSVRWAKKDLTEEEIASNANRSKQRGPMQPSASALNLLQMGTDELKCSLATISDTVHPLQSFFNENFNKLLEENEEISSSENFINYSSEVELESGDSDRPTYDSHLQMEFPTSNENIKKTYSSARSEEDENLSLENRLKRDFEGIGILCDDGPVRVDDEIVLEMKRCVAQMKALGTNNAIQLKRCLKLAEDEMKKQDIRQKLRACDSEIVFTHQKIQLSKLRRDSAYKRDRDYAWKLLKNREGLIKQLDSFNDQD